MIKNRLIKVIFIALFVVFVTNIQALSSFPSTITTKSEGLGLTLNSDLTISATSSMPSNLQYPYFHIKNSTDDGNIICVSGLGENEPKPGLTCSKVSWESTNQAKGVAYIINTIIGTGGSASVSNEKYFWSEVLINAYLGTYTPNSGSYMNVNVIEAGAKIAGTGLTYNEILTRARNYASADYSSSLSADKTNLSFTLNSDGYYYSEPVTITSSTTYSLASISNSKFSYSNNGNTYTFKIKSSDIALGGSESFSITVSNNGKEYYTAQRYDCGSGYQNVTLSQTVKSTTSGNSLTITGSVSKSTVGIKVAKVDNNDKFISGAKLNFQTDAQRKNSTDGQIVVSTTDYVAINNLKAGTYYLSEKEAPNGYDLSKQVIKIEIDNNGNVKVDGKSSNGLIKIANELTKVEINKVDSKTNKPIAGAVLQVLDSKGNELYKWTTTEDKYVITGLLVGKYQLKEIEAPLGYALNSKVKTFEVKGDGTVTEVTMENEKVRVVINKISIANSKLLPGATLEIQDEKGNIIKYCKDEKGNSIECKWVSTDKPYEIEGMPNGKYYLIETIAPEGYELSKEKIEFIVDGKDVLVEVEMKNALEVKVPDTLSSRSVLLLAIAMFDIALGIGIVAYVKKNKIQE